jgi:flagellum-specific peptidoglycan hydrolase FlgJ
MQSTLTFQQVEAYVRVHWFKLILIGLAIFVFLRKDFSFSINLNNPDKTEQESSVPLKEVGRPQKDQKKSSPITEEREIAKASGSTSFFDMLPSMSLRDTKSTSKQSEFLNLSESVKEGYIDRFAKVAISERKKYGIPASIILANGLLHSAAGTRNMSLTGNNHFALPCTTNWKGESATYNDACYRHYENAWMSFRDHSLYLTTGSTSDLVRLGNKDYQAWAKAIEQLSVFEIENLSDKLVQIIEQHKLDKLDDL